MKAEMLLEMLGADYYAGVPDSQLKALCAALMQRYGIDPAHHVIAANEGNAAAMAAGYHLATGRVPVVYMQNSGEGNMVNPAASLLHRKVYGIPVIFIIGWRGEPGVHDEPQHIRQGEITLDLLKDLDIPAFILSRDTAPEELSAALRDFRSVLNAGGSVAIVVRKGALTCDSAPLYRNDAPMLREEIIRRVLDFSGDDPVVCTTGKAGRELFELREAAGQDHSRDFLTVGSMGHASSIALGLACARPDRRVWCIDGDGAVLMHMGAMGVIGTSAPGNLIHIVINNAAHESVGGMPTVCGDIDLIGVAAACGYPLVCRAETPEQLTAALEKAVSASALCFIEVRCAIGARENLGRPTSSPGENKRTFMSALGSFPLDTDPGASYTV